MLSEVPKDGDKFLQELRLKNLKETVDRRTRLTRILEVLLIYKPMGVALHSDSKN